ncbi:MAG: cob(I)yrinic acid a,c-diamide adenosyltransferase [Candidatus Magasanikbacteria bacterium]|jgi:cob(I)alamin adenosyltransferase
MTKIYTKTGDSGETTLLGGERVTKDCITLQVVGEIDELNSKLGEVVAHLWEEEPVDFLKKIQGDLFKAGAEVASLQTEFNSKIIIIGQEEIEELENNIDAYAEQLPELTNFILPGGNLSAAHLHHARTICRRVERVLVMLGKEKKVRPELYKYFNRLSDYFFIAARWINFNDGVEEHKV